MNTLLHMLMIYCAWLREMKKKYEYIATYADDLLIALTNHIRLFKT